MRNVPITALALAVLGGCPNPDRRISDIGGECEVVGDCVDGAVCAHDGTCQYPGTPGTTGDGEDCVSTTQCQLGLACASDGTCAPEGSPGTAAFDEACEVPTDCAFGLSCFDEVCKGLEMPLWLGGSCPDPDDEGGPFRVFFEIPGDEPLADFYRLPFPNDARVNDAGRLDLSGHPSPGPLVDLVGDAVGNLIRVVEEDLDGRFGPNQAVYLRFSDYPNDDKLLFGIPGTGTVALVDLTPDAPDDGFVPFRYEVRSRATPYLCHNWMVLHPINGRPLEPGRTYAAVLATAIEDDAGNDLVQDADFTAMVSDTAPSETRLQRGWNAYRPLREWLAAKAIPAADVAAAAVFTVQDPTARAKAVRTGVLAADLPVLEGAVRCGDSDPFAVAGDDSRGCSGVAGAWDEVQGTLPLPQFQVGTPPFKDFVDGGAIPDADPPPVARTDDVHVAIAVPNGVDMPAAGWPVILYAHGTGGSYTSFLREGLAERFTAADADGTVVPFAVLGFDAPMHGPRSHPENHDAAWLDVDPSAYDPDILFFNPLNVRAARDNGLQQAADTWAIVRWLAAVDLDGTASPTGEPLRFDMDNLYYLGHSQGGVVGPVAVAWEPEFEGAIFSGAGGLLIETLVGKKSPHDLAAALRVGLADPDVSRVHPVLNLAQQLAESGDAVNHARHVLRMPPEGAAARHVFQIYGVGDTYTPDASQYALARQLGLQQVINGQTPLQSLSETALPVSGNTVSGATGVVQLYGAAGGQDAHFVLFEDTKAPAQAAHFFASGVLDGVPTVPSL